MTSELLAKKIRNNNGMEIALLNLGATLADITIKDAEGRDVSMTLGFDSPEDYAHDRQYMGATPGRYSNRIAFGKFKLGGVVYHLPPNDGEHQLHGGEPSFAYRIWEMEEEPEENRISFTYTSPDGENGYPGELRAGVSYELNDDNEVVMRYTATSDADTVVNLTNHAYFNLSGTAGSVLDHELELCSEYVVVNGENYNPTGEIRLITGTPMDFTSPRKLGDVVFADYDEIRKCKGLDSCFAIRGEGLRRAATLYDPASGRTLEVDSDMPGVQVYTSQMMPEGTIGRGGVTYGPYQAVCLEAQDYPDAPNHPHFPSAVLKKGEVYSRTIVYRVKW